MKTTIRNAALALLASTSAAYATGGPDAAGGNSFLLILFLGFVALIIVFQFIPGLVLFFGMLRGLFSAGAKKATPAAGAKLER
jgi:hypothetical protein